MNQNKSNSANSIKVLGENKDGYDVLITSVDQKTGKIVEHKDFIKRELFDSSVRLGYLEKIES